MLWVLSYFPRAGKNVSAWKCQIQKQGSTTANSLTRWLQRIRRSELAPCSVDLTHLVHEQHDVAQRLDRRDDLL